MINTLKIFDDLRETRDASAARKIAETQKKTYASLKELVNAQSDINRILGGLSDAVRYDMEDRAIKSLPEVLKNKYGIEVCEPLVRKFVKYNGKRDEVNIYGTAKKGDRNIHIIGEAKSRLGRKHIDDFIKLISRLEENRIISGEKFLLTITYSVEPEIEEYARSKGVIVIWSFEI